MTKLSSKEINRRAWIHILKIMSIFGPIAIGAAVVGSALDKAFNSKPLFTLAILVVAYVISWLILLRQLKKIKETSK